MQASRLLGNLLVLILISSLLQAQTRDTTSVKTLMGNGTFSQTHVREIQRETEILLRVSSAAAGATVTNYQLIRRLIKAIHIMHHAD